MADKSQPTDGVEWPVWAALLPAARARLRSVVSGPGVSPLRGAGLLRYRVEPLSKAQRLAPDGRPSLTRARRQPPRSLARRMTPDFGPAGLAGSLANRAIKAAPSSHESTANQAGCAGVHTRAARSRVRESRSLMSFTPRVNDEPT